MSAYLDSYSGAGYDGSDTGGIGDVGASTNGDAPFSMSAFTQALASQSLGYMSRRVDIDLSRRLQGAMPEPSQRGNAPRVRVSGQGVPQPGKPEDGEPMSMRNVLMLGAAAAAAFFLATG